MACCTACEHGAPCASRSKVGGLLDVASGVYNAAVGIVYDAADTIVTAPVQWVIDKATGGTSAGVPAMVTPIFQGAPGTTPFPGLAPPPGLVVPAAQAPAIVEALLAAVPVSVPKPAAQQLGGLIAAWPSQQLPQNAALSTILALAMAGKDAAAADYCKDIGKWAAQEKYENRGSGLGKALFELAGSAGTYIPGSNAGLQSMVDAYSKHVPDYAKASAAKSWPVAGYAIPGGVYS